MTKDFDYEDFSKNMAEQAKKLVPGDISEDAKNYIVSTLENYTKLAGEGLCNDDSINLDVQSINVIAQIIAEWTFHKCVDLARSAVPAEHWDSITSKIAFTIFEVAKQGYQSEVPEAQLLQAVEHHVNEVWDASIKDLLKKQVLTEEEANAAQKLSSIDDMANAVSNEQEVDNSEDDVEIAEIDIETDKNSESDSNNKENKIDNTDCHAGTIEGLFNLMKAFAKAATSVTIAFLKIGLIIGIFLGVIKLYCYLHEPSAAPAFIQNHSDDLTVVFGLYIIAIVIKTFSILVNANVQNHIEQLKKVRQDMRALADSDKMYKQLGVDKVCLLVGSGLLEIADPETDGMFLANLAVLRQRMTDELGYVIPYFHIMDSSELEAYEYNILIRDNVVASGFVYPGMYMVYADEWDSVNKNIPEDAIVGVNPLYNNFTSGIHFLCNTQVYWVYEKDLTKKIKTAMTPVDIMIKHIEEIFINHVDSLLTIHDIQRYVEVVRSDNPVLVDTLIPELIPLSDLRTILVNLIRERVSIKDIVFIFERLCDYARFSKAPDILSERLRAAISRQICLNNIEKDKTLYALTLSPEWEKTLDDSCQRTESGEMFLLNPVQVQELVESISLAMMRAYKNFNVQPVILSPPKIRLPLYQLLVRHIPTVVVVSYSELITDIYVETVETIGKDTEPNQEDIYDE